MQMGKLPCLCGEPHSDYPPTMRLCLFEPEIRLQPSDYSACASDSRARAQPQIDRAIARAQALALSGQPATVSAAILVSAR